MRLLAVFVLVTGLVLVASGCGGDDDNDSSANNRRHDRRDARVRRRAADPVVLDGALVSDGESLRVIDQIFETLVTLKPGTTELVPGLAESWEPRRRRQGLDVHSCARA